MDINCARNQNCEITCIGIETCINANIACGDAWECDLMIHGTRTFKYGTLNGVDSINIGVEYGGTDPAAFANIYCPRNRCSFNQIASGSFRDATIHAWYQLLTD